MAKTKSKIKKFRSKLEVHCNEELLKAGLTFEYEPNKYVLIEKLRYPGVSLEVIGKKRSYKQQREGIAAITYTPDFVGDTWIIETKGYRTPQFNIKWKLFKKHLSDNKIDVDLYMPTNKTQIKETISKILEKNDTKIREISDKRSKSK